MAIIEDGAGKGFRASVDSSNRLNVKAVVEPEFEQASEDGQAYVWSTDIVSLSAGMTVLLVKNTSDTNLHIEAISVSNGVTPTEYTFHLPTIEVTVTGTTVVGVNLNTGSANVADASAATEETNNTQGDVISTRWLAADRSEVVRTPGLILAKNKSVAVDVVVTTAETAASMIGHYESE